MRGGFVRIEFERGATGGQRFLKAAQFAQRVAQIFMSADQARLERDGLSITDDGIVELLAVFEDVTEIDVGFGRLGIETNGLDVALRCTASVTEGSKGGAEVHVKGSLAGLDRDGLLDEADGGLRVLPVEFEEPEQMQGVGLTRLGGEDLPIERLGFSPLTGGVELDGALQDICESGGRSANFRLSGRARRLRAGLFGSRIYLLAPWHGFIISIGVVRIGGFAWAVALRIRQGTVVRWTREGVLARKARCGAARGRGASRGGRDLLPCSSRGRVGPQVYIETESSFVNPWSPNARDQGHPHPSIRNQFIAV